MFRDGRRTLTETTQRGSRAPLSCFESMKMNSVFPVAEMQTMERVPYPRGEGEGGWGGPRCVKVRDALNAEIETLAFHPTPRSPPFKGRGRQQKARLPKGWRA